MSGAASRRKGLDAERAFVRWLRTSGGQPYAERRGTGLSGGDVTGTPGVTWEIKNHARLDLAGWVDQCEAARSAEGNSYGIVIAKRPRQSNPAAWYAILPAYQLVELLSAAGLGAL